MHEAEAFHSEIVLQDDEFKSPLSRHEETKGKKTRILERKVGRTFQVEVVSLEMSTNSEI